MNKVITIPILIVMIFLLGCQAHYEDIIIHYNDEEILVNTVDIDDKNIYIDTVVPETQVLEETLITGRRKCPVGISECIVCGNGTIIGIGESCYDKSKPDSWIVTGTADEYINPNNITIENEVGG